MKRWVTYVSTAALVLGLSGCAQNGQMSNEGAGTLTGGVVGALIGSQFGNDSGQAVAIFGGAILGGYLGNQIGKSMDETDRQRLQSSMNNQKASTVRFHDGARYRTGNVYVRKGRMYRKITFVDSSGTTIHGRAVCKSLSSKSGRCKRWEITS